MQDSVQVVVESDKADMDVESFDNGILGAIVINEGGVANVGAPIAYIAESEADMEAAQAKAGGSTATPAAAPVRPSNLMTLSVIRLWWQDSAIVYHAKVPGQHLFRGKTISIGFRKFLVLKKTSSRKASHLPQQII